MPCLESKTWCDRTKPSCRKCLKTRRPCGYRDPFGIILRDETQSTIRKVQARTRANSIAKQSSKMVPLSFQRPGRGHSRTPSNTSDTSDTSGTAVSSLILQAPRVPLADQAQCYFLANFVPAEDICSKRCARGPFSFVLRFLQSSERTDPLVSNCWAAASMAALAGRPNSRMLASRARAYYDTALSKLNKALHDPERVRENSTLLSVLLLSIYEVTITKYSFPKGDTRRAYPVPELRQRQPCRWVA